MSGANMALRKRSNAFIPWGTHWRGSGLCSGWWQRARQGQACWDWAPWKDRRPGLRPLGAFGASTLALQLRRMCVSGRVVVTGNLT
jgi:hypothetical protein